MRKCPYCEGKVIVDKQRERDGNMSYDVIVVRCVVCGLSSQGCTTFYGRNDNPEQDAIDDWENRICKLKK